MLFSVLTVALMAGGVEMVDVVCNASSKAIIHCDNNKQNDERIPQTVENAH